MTLPILVAHDTSRPIGKVAVEEDGSLIVQLLPEHALTEEQFFETFGNCGVRILNFEYRGGVRHILTARLLEFSRS